MCDITPAFLNMHVCQKDYFSFSFLRFVQHLSKDRKTNNLTLYSIIRLFQLYVFTLATCFIKKFYKGHFNVGPMVPIHALVNGRPLQIIAWGISRLSEDQTRYQRPSKAWVDPGYLKVKVMRRIIKRLVSYWMSICLVIF